MTASYLVYLLPLFFLYWILYQELHIVFINHFIYVFKLIPLIITQDYKYWLALHSQSFEALPAHNCFLAQVTAGTRVLVIIA